MPKPPKIPKQPTPPRPQSWDRPPRPDKGDPTEEAVWAAVGRALSRWEALEYHLSAIFGVLITPAGETLPAQRAYGSILTFRGRKEMIDAAAEAVFFLRPNVDLAAKLKRLLNEIQQFSGRRNEIAHASVMSYYGPAGTKAGMPPELLKRPDKATFVLSPPEYATNKTALRPARFLLEGAHHDPHYAYSSAEIGVFEQHFVRLVSEVQDLHLQLSRNCT